MERIIIKDGTGEIVEKKSRFIANVKAVKSEEEAIAFINEVKKKYWDARHNCMAYVVNDIQRFSDDGEPSGTAGKPILDVTTGRELGSLTPQTALRPVMALFFCKFLIFPIAYIRIYMI